jgi:hypothetical protein
VGSPRAPDDVTSTAEDKLLRIIWLALAFRSSCSTSAPTFHELREVTGSSKFRFLVPLFHLKFLNGICRLQRRNFKWAALVTAAAMLIAAGGMAFADGSGDPAAVKSEDGKYVDKQGNPIGTPIRVTAVITPSAMSVTGPTAWDRVMPRRSRTRSRR